MAKTEAGRELTAAHKRAQVLVSAELAVRADDYLSLFDLSDIDGSSIEWIATMQTVVEQSHSESARLAAKYLDDFTLAEIGELHGQKVTPMFNRAQVFEDMRVNGPVRMKALIKRGVDPEDALLQIYAGVAGAAMNAALEAGRDLIDKSVRYYGRSGRYRRVTDSKPCAFCAMIASRGPVYTEVSSNFRTHDYCGCTAEPVLGEWVPSDEEALWRASYKWAAMDADDEGLVRTAPTPHSDAEDNILWRMRRNSPHLFSDGVKPKQK